MYAPGIRRTDEGKNSPVTHHKINSAFTSPPYRVVLQSRMALINSNLACTARVAGARGIVRHGMQECRYHNAMKADVQLVLVQDVTPKLPYLIPAVIQNRLATSLGARRYSLSYRTLYLLLFKTANGASSGARSGL